MAEVFRYEVIPSTSWAYLSTILMVSIYFKFNRLISIRNLDILMLAMLAPGLLFVQHGDQQQRAIEKRLQDNGIVLQDYLDSKKDEDESGDQETFTDGESADTPPVDPSDVSNLEESNLKNQIVFFVERLKYLESLQFTGYVWLFFVGGMLMIRMLIDPYMIRRPLLEPNLEFSGLTFLTIVLLFFLIANIVAATVTQEDITAAESGKDLATAKAKDTSESNSKGPGYSLLFLFPTIPTFVAEPAKGDSNEDAAKSTSLTVVTKIMAIFGQLVIVVGIYLIGFLHFNNTRMGIGIVTLYLLLPYTAEMTGRIIHILPAAAMVWAVVCYRKPFWSGSFIGLAMGLAYYPLFLLPLWFSFYWHRGLRRFLFGFLTMVAVLASTLILTSSDVVHFWQNVRAMFGLWAPIMDGLQGFWAGEKPDSSYRIPVIAAFFCLSISFAAWPAQKNLGTLLSCSAALMLAVQFWNGFGGGVLMAWYLPLALMTMFRPNLEDRTAVSLTLEK